MGLSNNSLKKGISRPGNDAKAVSSYHAITGIAVKRIGKHGDFSRYRWRNRDTPN